MMGPEELDGLLRESDFLRNALVDLLQASEQALSIVATALARQVDAARLAADLLALQQAAAVDDPNPTRDRLLGTIRCRLPLSPPD